MCIYAYWYDEHHLSVHRLKYGEEKQRNENTLEKKNKRKTKRYDIFDQFSEEWLRNGWENNNDDYSFFSISIYLASYWSKKQSRCVCVCVYIDLDRTRRLSSNRSNILIFIVLWKYAFFFRSSDKRINQWHLNRLFSQIVIVHWIFVCSIGIDRTLCLAFWNPMHIMTLTHTQKFNIIDFSFCLCLCNKP